MEYKALFSSGCSGDCYNRNKLSNPKVILRFIKKAESILGIKSENLYVLKFAPPPQDIYAREFIRGGSINERASIFVETDPYTGLFSYMVLTEQPLTDEIQNRLYNLEDDLR